MDEVRIVKHRTHIWPVIIALVVLALVIGYVLFAMNGPSGQVGWNGLPRHMGAHALMAGTWESRSRLWDGQGPIPGGHP